MNTLLHHIQPKDCKDQFLKCGYAIASEVFSASEVSLVKKHLQELVKQGKELGRQNQIPENGRLEHGGATFVLAGTQDNISIKRVVGCGSLDSTLLDMTRQPGLLKLVGSLLECTELDQIICQFHPKEPGDNVTFRIHRDVANRLRYDRDWQDAAGNGSYVVACIAIDPVTTDNGGLEVLPGSHLGYDLFSDSDPDNPVLTAEQEERFLLPTLEAGGVLFMHPYLLHRSSANTSAHSRYTLLGGYAAPGANSKPYPGGWCVHQRIALSGEVVVKDLFSTE